MPSFLILKLEGALQAWGDHTFEDYRPTVGFPTRSGLLGLIGACLGIERTDTQSQSALDASLYFTVRADTKHNKQGKRITIQYITDFHTVLDARKVDITKCNEYPVLSTREYLCDASFTVAMESTEHVVFYLDAIEGAVKHPIYTPVLGRRSCPLSRPLFAKRIEADNPLTALLRFETNDGTVYSDSPRLTELAKGRTLRLRDVPRYTRKRQFATRQVFVFAGGSGNVSE